MLIVDWDILLFIVNISEISWILENRKSNSSMWSLGRIFPQVERISRVWQHMGARGESWLSRFDPNFWRSEKEQGWGEEKTLQGGKRSEEAKKHQHTNSDSSQEESCWRQETRRFDYICLKYLKWIWILFCILVDLIVKCLPYRFWKGLGSWAHHRCYRFQRWTDVPDEVEGYRRCGLGPSAARKRQVSANCNKVLWGETHVAQSIPRRRRVRQSRSRLVSRHALLLLT